MTTKAPGKVVTFGELMLRLNPPGHERLVQAQAFEVRFTGGEANAAVLLAGLDVPATTISRVPANELGQACINYLRRFGVDTSHVARGGDRLGLFYLETGAAQRPSKVIYDRDNAAIRGITVADVDWPAALEGAAWFHFSGTAPALGPNVREVLVAGLEEARRRDVMVSCDLNYRAKLWGAEEPGPVMRELMPFVHVLIGNEEDAAKVFDVRAERTDVSKGLLDTESYKRVAESLRNEFGFRYVATTLRTSRSASINEWAGLLFDGASHCLSRSYEILPIVDRVGGGDAFSGGLIYGLLHWNDPQRTVDFAAAASCLKHSIPGDFAQLSLQEIEALAAGDSSGRVQR